MRPPDQLLASAFQQQRQLREAEYETKRQAALRARRLNPELELVAVARRVGIDKKTVRRWWAEAGLLEVSDG